MAQIQISRMRSCGAFIGAQFQYLGATGHVRRFAAWSTGKEVQATHTEYGNEVPLYPISAETADAMARCLASAARYAKES